MNTPLNYLAYDPKKLFLSPGTVIGLFDTDGTYSIHIGRTANYKRNYYIELRFFQLSENADVVDSLLYTFGFGKTSVTPAK